jgi:hypothetical protein
MDRKAQQLLITESSVSHGNFAGARERGMASSPEAPAGWDHSGLVTGNEERPIGALRPGPDGMHYFNLRRAGRVPPPGSMAGSAKVGAPGKVLPSLVQKSIGASNLTGAGVVGALGGPRVVRFVLTDGKGASTGYSIVFAP